MTKEMQEVVVKLVDLNDGMVDAWKSEFGRYGRVEIVRGSIFETRAEAIVSPANSFGIMDGGLDGKLRDHFGANIERAVRIRIKDEYLGELPVGCAITVETGNAGFPYLISAPTMRVPEDVSRSRNAYLAMRAILIECQRNRIKSVAIPGLCALSGRMPYPIVARQMRVAYDKIVRGELSYSHWREEKALQEYMGCETSELPYDYGP